MTNVDVIAEISKDNLITEAYLDRDSKRRLLCYRATKAFLMGVHIFLKTRSFPTFMHHLLSYFHFRNVALPVSLHCLQSA